MSPSGSMTAQVGHVGINVVNIRRSVEFYKEVFGFEVVRNAMDEEKPYAFLAGGGRLILTLWQQSEGSFQTNRAGLHHLSFQVDSIDDVKKYYERLKSLNVTFLREGLVSHREGASSGGIYFQDPDGIRLEIFASSNFEGYQPHKKNEPTCGFF